MSQMVVLDTDIVGKATHPNASNSDCKACKKWLDLLPSRRYLIALPEIVDYEIRRELIRADKVKGIRRLDQLKAAIIYLPITTETMVLAAQLWAEARKRGKPTADLKN